MLTAADIVRCLTVAHTEQVLGYARQPFPSEVSNAYSACLECGHGSAFWIQGVGLRIGVDDFLCAECAHVWHTPRNEPDAVPTVVVQGKRKRRELADEYPLLFNRPE